MNNAGEQARGLGAGASGFSLIETVIAIAVIAVTFIGLIGLLGLGVVNDQTSSEQTVANNIAASILADLRSTPTYSTTSTRYKLTLPTSAPASSAAPLSGLTASVLYFDNSPVFISLNPASVPANAVYVANVYMTRIGSIGPAASLQSNDLARIVVSWPAKTAAGTAPAGSIDVISQFLIH
jgi:prepilin-type N-terminal cleavage/methylation domain-containing protein